MPGASSNSWQARSLMAKQFLNRPKQPPKDSAIRDDDRFAAADAAMARGGYAGSAPKASNQKLTRSPTSFSLTEADRARLMKLQGELMTTGRSVSKTDLIRIALAALEVQSVEERAHLFDELG